LEESRKQSIKELDDEWSRKHDASVEELNNQINEMERSKETLLSDLKTKFQTKKKVIIFV